ncbi:hypothetical protein [Spirosoma endbachense]|uniref:Uncharacterized protein n=1 Tax=Spirosoma endbachense TaxID=2666025 RepID=A0A6P1VXP1_9BACT|nr:hypothetical protein [Spirosoma endbachense]QHV97883.1 hypothetical protein GJR95_24020 [Spirosoma endbachense]
MKRMNKPTLPQFTLETGQRPALNALEQHLLTVAARWCADTNSIGSIDEFKKKLESEAAWFCHEHRKSETSIEIGRYDETMLYIKPAGRNIRATATIRLAETENDLGYELQAAHSAGYYTPRFL